MLALVETMKENGYDKPIDVAASRAGTHAGTHEIGFDSAADTITIRHTARGRDGFARGRPARGPMARREKGLLRFSRHRQRTGIK